MTMGLGVMMALTGVVLGSNPSPTTYYHRVSAHHTLTPTWTSTHPEREVLRGEDSAQMFLLIDDQYAVGSLRGAELRRI